MTNQLPRLISALPLMRQGDGARLCRQFCSLYATKSSAHRIPAHLRLKDGPHLCVCHCAGFAEQKPVTIHRPRARGRTIARHLAKEAAR